MRIRSTKPEFWRSRDISRLSIPTRLLFMGIWSYVDDNGVGRDELALIAADLFAHDLSRDPTETLRMVSTGLTDLEEGGLIVRYEVDGQPLLYVCKWDKHQRIQNPGKARWSRPEQVSQDSPDTLDRPSGDSTEDLSPGAVEQWSSGAVEKPALLDVPSASGEGAASPRGQKKSGNDTPEHHAAVAAFDAIKKAGKFMGVKDVAKYALKDRGVDQDEFVRLVVAIHSTGRPVTRGTMGQAIDGSLRLAPTSAPRHERPRAELPNVTQMRLQSQRLAGGAS